jgi:hypothetical protein
LQPHTPPWLEQQPRRSSAAGAARKPSSLRTGLRVVSIGASVSLPSPEIFRPVEEQETRVSAAVVMRKSRIFFIPAYLIGLICNSNEP